MKSKTFFLLGSLVLSQSVISPLYATAQSEEMSLLSVCRQRHHVHLNIKKEHYRDRSASPIATGYVEDNVLYLSFNYLPKKASLRVVDAETGATVFEGAVAGTSLSIPLDVDSERFEIYIEENN